MEGREVEIMTILTVEQDGEEARPIALSEIGVQTVVDAHRRRQCHRAATPTGGGSSDGFSSRPARSPLHARSGGPNGDGATAIEAGATRVTATA